MPSIHMTLKLGQRMTNREETNITSRTGTMVLGGFIEEKDDRIERRIPF